MGYNWNWGNGQSSLSALPTYKYPVSGTYVAILKVSSSFGCVDSMVRTITVYDRPFTGFSVDNACVGQGDVTVFNNSTVFSGGAQNLDYKWTFDDFTTSTEMNPSKEYTSKGNRIISMLAVDKLNGCRDSVTRTIAFYNKPVAQFATASGDFTCENNELQVINTSYTIDNDPFKCLWIWGDSKTDTICSTNHTYNGHGFYNINLVTTTIYGCKDTAVKPLTVNTIPELVITVTDLDTANYPYCKNRKLLSANIEDAESYTWKIVGPGTNKSLFGKDIDNVFAGKGLYTVDLTVKDNAGCVVSKSIQVDIYCGVGLESSLAASYDLNTYPNPFGDATTLSFDLPKATDVKVSVLDMLGRTIKSKNLGRLQAGKHQELMDEFGSAGTYLIKVEMDGTAIYKQVIKQ
jgi:PKD repeat protein